MFFMIVVRRLWRRLLCSAGGGVGCALHRIDSNVVLLRIRRGVPLCPPNPPSLSTSSLEPRASSLGPLSRLLMPLQPSRQPIHLLLDLLQPPTHLLHLRAPRDPQDPLSSGSHDAGCVG